MTQDACRALFHQKHDAKDLAASINSAMPGAACEIFSVGEGSPGPVANNERLVRLAISPRDFDENGGLALSPFLKVFEQGLSVMRDCATDEDYLEQALEILPHPAEKPHRQVAFIVDALTSEVRGLNDSRGRLFAVYDQVVPRFRATDKPPICTHVGVFAIQFPPKGPPKKGERPPNQVKKDIALKLFDLFIKGRIDVPAFRNNLFEDTNRRARDLEFQLPSPPSPEKGQP